MFTEITSSYFHYENFRITESESWGCGDIFFDKLLKGSGTLILDCDGVIIKSDSLLKPAWTSNEVPGVLRDFEKIGGQIGLATARSQHIVEFMHQYGIRLEGPVILEGGHDVKQGDKHTRLSQANYREFISKMRVSIPKISNFCDTWDDVQVKTRVSADSIWICHGDIQWNGHSRATFWYDWRNESRLGVKEDTIRREFLHELSLVAQDFGVSENEFDVKLSRMDNGLGIIRIAANIGDSVISKETAARRFYGDIEPVYVADGDGDYGFEQYIRTYKKGIVVAVGGSHDLTPEVPAFISDADISLKNSLEFVDAMKYAISLWKFQRSHESL